MDHLLMSNNESYIEVAKFDEIPSGKMKHIEFNGKEIINANLDGKFYALNDRCSHTTAPISMGHIQGNIVTCPMHGARFDNTTGKNVSAPRFPSLETDSLPVNLQKYMDAGRLLSQIKTYDQEVYEVKVEGSSIKLRL
jgi:nitrite reductase/ring-hydroxylating ferredoxin subunit